MSAQQVRTVSVIAILIVATVTSAVLFTSIELAAKPQDQPPDVVSVGEYDLRLALHRVGLQPERLAAAGVSVDAVASVVQDMRQHLVVNPGPAPFDQAVGEAEAEHLRLGKLIRSGQASDQDMAAYGLARSEWDAVKASRDANLDAMFAAAASGLPDVQSSVLATMRSNESWKMPVEFLAIDMTESDRLELRHCLANERIAAKRGEIPDSDAQTQLSDLRAHPVVSVAMTSLESNLAAVMSAWEAAVQQE